MVSFVRPIGMFLFAAAAHGAMAASPLPAEAAGGPHRRDRRTWLTAAKSEVTVAPCDNEYCGNISKIVVPADILKKDKSQIEALGTSNFTDLMNKDPSLRTRPILGLTILKLQPSDKPTIFNGQIYNPQDGNTYSGYVEVLGPDKIRLNGCILYNVICKGEDWTRGPPTSRRPRPMPSPAARPRRKPRRRGQRRLPAWRLPVEPAGHVRGGWLSAGRTGSCALPCPRRRWFPARAVPRWRGRAAPPGGR